MGNNIPYHGSGDNVVFIPQLGGGKNCDCRKAHFEIDPVPPRILNHMTRQEYHDLLARANRILRRIPHPLWIILIIVIMIAGTQVGIRLGISGVHGRDAPECAAIGKRFFCPLRNGWCKPGEYFARNDCCQY
eukprot:g3829.t1